MPCLVSSLAHGTAAAVARDYKAEYQRRNAKAQARGFKSYGAYRHAVETGKIQTVQPKRLSSPRTIKAQSRFNNYFSRGRSFAEMKSDAQDWAAAHAGTEIAEYDPARALTISKTSEAEYLTAYTEAFVSGPNRYGAVRHQGGSEELRHYWVDITGWLSAKEYDEKYLG